MDRNINTDAFPDFNVALNGFLTALSDMQIPLHGVTIIKDNKVLAEKCFGGFTPDTKHRMYSVAKSFASLAVGCIADEGLINLDDKICDYFPEMLPEEGASRELSGLTIRQMLSMTTCYSKSTYNADENWLRSFFVAKPDHEPGTLFCYDTSSSFVIGALVEKLTGMKLLDYLRKKCLDEIGFSKDAYIMTDNYGVSDCGSGMMCSMRDMAKVANLCMNNGEYNGKKLLPEDYLKQAFSRQSVTDLQDSAEERHGYGYMFWKTRYDGYCMYGMGGQFAACYPKLGLIFVTIADTKENVGGVQLLWRAFYDYIYMFFDKDASKEAKIRSECFPPVIVKAAHPAVEKLNKRFICKENSVGIKNFFVDLDNNCVEFEDNKGKHNISFGVGEWKSYKSIEGFDGVASGNWVSDTNYVIKIYTFGEEPSHVFVEIGVNDDRSSVRLKASGNSLFSIYKNKFIEAVQE